jgi:hypothetical protein
MPIQVAAELSPHGLRLVAAQRLPHQPPRFVAALTVNPQAAKAREQLRVFRREHRLPQAIRLLYWPRPGEAGVTPVEERPSGKETVSARALTVRGHAQVLIGAGFLVERVLLPHEVLAMVAMQHGAPLAVVVGLHDSGGCFGFSRRGHASHVASYLVWPPSAAAASTAASPKARLLKRYQFAALLAPHLTALARTAPAGSRVLMCGSLEGLREKIGPLIEELDREIEVLDEAAGGLAEAPSSTLTQGPAAWRLVWAAASE